MIALSSISDPIRLGAAGLGRAFALTAPAIHAHPGISLVAAADPNTKNRSAFEMAFNGTSYSDVPELVADPNVEVVYISTPHGMHLNHALQAINAGKHVLVEKPMTISLDDASQLIQAANASGVNLAVGPSHSHDGPVALAQEMIAAGMIGQVRMIHAFYATDFLYRPRTSDELKTELGGGVIFSQAIHQIDVVRRLAGKPACAVTARTGGAWDSERPTEGAYSMLIDFEDDLFASLTYSGYAHYDGDRLMGNISEVGVMKPDSHGDARQKLAMASDETEFKKSRGFTSLADCPQSEAHEHFGQVIVFGDLGDLRLSTEGVELSNNTSRDFYKAPFKTTRAEVFDSLYANVREGRPIIQDGLWGRASLEICHALLASAKNGNTIKLKFQIG